MRIWHFVITRRDTGTPAGHALLCPEARYASVRWARETRLERRHGTPRQWIDGEAESRKGWPKGTVDPAAAVHSLLLSDDAKDYHRLTLLVEPPIAEGDTAGAFVAQLDAYLWQQHVAGDLPAAGNIAETQEQTWYLGWGEKKAIDSD